MITLVNSLRIDYEMYGKGDDVLFIHGFPFSKEMWKPQVEALRDTHRVIVYDVRGHGGSDVGDGQYSIEYFVDDVLGLLDHLGSRNVTAVGLSMGGYIVLRAVERNPDRFRALVLCDTRSEADSNEGKIKRAQHALAVKRDGAEAFARDFVKAVFYEKTAGTNPQAVQSIRETIGRTSPVAIAGTLLALAARTDTTSFLPTIKIPTLILVGQHDNVTPPSASQAMRERIPGAEMHVIPDAAHMSNLENPEEFNRHLRKFLQKFT